uniref:Uncharacterized protein n=1 Tax=Nelumbo nucifera TaxID=4432 RepID=A0A822YYC5_NELNU|nr:TPA_asm: hypothetical protein HUJ06_008151 [Nelumbo nucifera]
MTPSTTDDSPLPRCAVHVQAVWSCPRSCRGMENMFFDDVSICSGNVAKADEWDCV